MGGELVEKVRIALYGTEVPDEIIQDILEQKPNIQITLPDQPSSIALDDVIE